MRITIKIGFPLVLKFEDECKSFGNALIKHVFPKYDDAASDKPSELEVTTGATEIGLVGKKISFSFTNRSSTISLSDELSDTEISEIISFYVKEISKRFEIDVINTIGFQFNTRLHAKDTTGLEIIKKYFYPTNIKSPINNYNSLEFKGAQYKNTFQEDNNIFNIIVSVTTPKAKYIDLIMQFEFKDKDLKLDKIYDYSDIKTVFLARTSDFVLDIQELKDSVNAQ